MKKIENPQIGYRFHILRELLLLTTKEVNFLTKIPLTNLRRIERGEISSREEVEILAELYQVKPEYILDTEILLPSWKELRRKGLEKHRNNGFYVDSINKKPRPKRAVMFRLLRSDFLNEYKSVAISTKKLKSLYSWSYDESRIDYALNTLVDEGVLDRLEEEGQPNKFRKTRSAPKQIWLISDRIVTELEEIAPTKNKDSLTPAHHQMAGMLYTLRLNPKSGNELFKTVLYSYSQKNISRSLDILLNIKLIERTESHTNSSKQMYRLTEKGRELLRKVGVSIAF